jgi:hypothetical protein
LRCCQPRLSLDEKIVPSKNYAAWMEAEPPEFQLASQPELQIRRSKTSHMPNFYAQHIIVDKTTKFRP